MSAFNDDKASDARDFCAKLGKRLPPEAETHNSSGKL